MGLYDSTYNTANSASAYSYLGSSTFLTTLKLGDNSAVSGGPTEFVLQSPGGQLAWGTDTGGHVCSDVNYPPPSAGIYCPVDLLIPASTSPQTPSELTVGNASTIQYTPGSYGNITYVLIEALASSTLNPQNGYVVVRWHNLSIVFTDSQGNQTTNPTYTDIYAYAGSYSPLTNLKARNRNKPAMLPPGKRKNQPMSELFNSVLATPSSNFVGGAVSVEVQGGIQLVSTDSVYANYNNGLVSTSLQAKIIVWTS